MDRPPRQPVLRQKTAKSRKPVPQFGWTVDRNHVHPINDLRAHKFTKCWCNPVEDDGIMVHKSLDGRERYQSGERKLS